jgi:uncharacterized membrane protein YccF (DUF307 family)
LRTLLNIVWLVLAGVWLAVGYAIAGVIMCILIVTIPFGLQAFKLARYSLWPFGRTVVKRPEAGGASVVGNIIWLLLAGWWLALLHLASALLLAITIIGVPLAVANVKLVPAALWPFGREIVRSADVSAALAAYRAQQAGGPGRARARAADPAAGRASEICRGAARVGAARAARDVGRRSGSSARSPPGARTEPSTAHRLDRRGSRG